MLVSCAILIAAGLPEVIRSLADLIFQTLLHRPLHFSDVRHGRRIVNGRLREEIPHDEPTGVFARSQRYTMVTEGVLFRWDLIRARPPAIRTASLDHLVRAGEQRRRAA
jgi:hypothetical protein